MFTEHERALLRQFWLADPPIKLAAISAQMQKPMSSLSTLAKGMGLPPKRLKRERASLKCEYCGHTFEVPAWRKDRGGVRFCSVGCHNRSHAAKVKHSDEARLENFCANIQCGTFDECWEWQGGLDHYGYGLAYVPTGNGRSKTSKAHRLAFELFYGISPGKLFVCHSCDNRPCCNPFHLWLGTNADNQEDKRVKGRGAVRIARDSNGRPLPLSKVAASVQRTAA